MSHSLHVEHSLHGPGISQEEASEDLKRMLQAGEPKFSRARLRAAGSSPHKPIGCLCQNMVFRQHSQVVVCVFVWCVSCVCVWCLGVSPK